ncbi:hypothetical protein NDN08_007060 [Rhodosorus marinus]|uniref:Cyclin N-terminal domain-containing protein n=1 Tax=Rhodosorus marinus TaxID=101924 RepID=A0AAV8UKN8_9RHOD|nr:hypothetical protein NDN08_007060 [Rhodosorus marinus]
MQRNAVMFVPNLESCEPSMIFYSSTRPRVSLKVFLFKIFKYLNCPRSVFVHALALMDRLATGDDQLKLNEYNVHRLFLAAVLLSERHFATGQNTIKILSIVAGISTIELTAIETMCLEMLEYRTDVDPVLYKAYADRVRDASVSARKSDLRTKVEKQNLRHAEKDALRRARRLISAKANSFDINFN